MNSLASYEVEAYNRPLQGQKLPVYLFVDGAYAYREVIPVLPSPAALDSNPSIDVTAVYTNNIVTEYRYELRKLDGVVWAVVAADAINDLTRFITKGLEHE